MLTHTVRPGDLILVEEHHLGEGRRICEILEVLNPGPTQHYRVRWDDGRESIYFPASDAHIQPSRLRGQESQSAKGVGR